MKQPIKVTPGSDDHLALMMAPWGLNMFTGKDRADILAWGRLVWENAYVSGAVPFSATIQEWADLVNELAPEGIEGGCDECGGDAGQCPATCCYRRARAMTAPNYKAKPDTSEPPT